MFDWLGDILVGMGDAIGIAFENTVGEMVNEIWSALIQWLYEAIYGAVANAFTGINQMGAEIFDLSWVSVVVKLFSLFGWALFTAGVVVAVFEVAVEYQDGRASIKGAALNVLKGFFAASLVGTLPIELYRFCVSLQNTFAKDIASVFIGEYAPDFGGYVVSVLTAAFNPSTVALNGLTALFVLIAFSYCVVKVFFSNIKRGGIMLIQIAVGELYVFSIPRGHGDGFNQWCKQVIAICLTAFMQTTLLYLGLLTFQDKMLLGLGIMLAANEVPRIAEHFGLDSSVRVNMTSVMHTTNTAVNMARMLVRAK